MATYVYGKRAQEFIDIVSEATRANGRDRIWWYTWFASRDRQNTRLWQDLSAGVESQPPASSATLRFAKWIAWAVVWVVAARLFGGRNALPEDADVVLLSVVNAGTVDRAGAYTSSYYGPLAAYLEARGERVVHCGLVEGRPWTTVRALNRVRTATVVTFGEFLGIGDLVSVAIQAARARFASSNPALSTRMAAELRHARSDIFLGILIERATQRLLARLPSARVIHTYENNPWEHACDNAARAAHRPVTGYLHCAVLPAHMKNYIAADEHHVRPAPDRIICTGERARDVFLSLGAHDPERVVAGCALRDSDVTKLPLRTTVSQPVRTVLVLLEGLASMNRALTIVEAAAKAAPERKFLLRAHPSLPLSLLTAQARIDIGPSAGQLDEAPSASLEAAISAADAVIYVGSTAAITAAYMGAPTLKLVLDDDVEDDPLFAAPVVPPRVRSADQIVATLQQIEIMPTETFQSNCAALRSYISQYLTPPTGNTMAVFGRMP